jgi:hypothetical protein
MSSILDSVTSAFGPDVLKSLGGALGADPSSVGKAMGAVGPLLLSGMSRATAAPGGADALMKMLPQDHGLLGNLGGMFGGLLGGSSPTGAAGLLPSLFGGATSAVAGTLSRALGFNVAPLLNLAAPALLAGVTKLVKEKGLDAVGLGATLKEQADAFMADGANADAAKLVDSAFTAADAAKHMITGYGDDWAKVMAGPAAALAAVASADLSGPVGSIKEARAAAETLEAAARAAAPSSVLATAFGAGLTTEMMQEVRKAAPTRDGLIAVLKAGADAVQARSPADAQAYKDTLMAVARATAEASKDGGFLGIGGKLVSDDEQKALDAIRSALG